MKKIGLAFAVVFLVFLLISPAKAGGGDPERCFELLSIKGPTLLEIDEAMDVCRGVLSPVRYAIFEAIAEDFFEKTLREARAYAVGKATKETQSKLVKP
ncbi:MAG: hypothetical protein WCO05_04615 [Candidatus Moraniibacteriota bacterium]